VDVVNVDDPQVWSGMPIAPARDPSDPPLPKVEVAVRFGARSRRAAQRFVNNDHYLILRLRRQQETVITSLPARDVPPDLDECGYGMLIADGLGEAGEIASRLAIATLVHMAAHFGKAHVRIDEAIAEEMMDRAERFYRAVNATLLQASDEGEQPLQTTLTAVYTAESEIFYAHVGHSRAYVLRDGQLMQLTRDGTTHAGPPGTGAAVMCDHHHSRSLSTETLGVAVRGVLRIDVERCGLMDGDLVLLCTNGLTDVVDDRKIADVLQLYGEPDDQCRALVDLAAAAGDARDVTVVVAQYHIQRRPALSPL
jgi:serine/threonine protein phosphatase PrpC